jgi:hypothetical protein
MATARLRAIKIMSIGLNVLSYSSRLQSPFSKRLQPLGLWLSEAFSALITTQIGRQSFSNR